MADELENKTGKDADASGVTFTPEQQAVVDRIAGERVARERSKYADYADLKGRLSTLEEEKSKREEAEKTERQKEIDAARKDERKAADKEWQGKLAARDREIAIRDMLRDAGADPDAGAFLTGDYEPETAEDIPEKVKQLLTDKPHLVLSKAGVAAQGAAGTPSALPGKTGEMTKARFDELRATGKWLESDERKLFEAGKLTLVD